MFVQWGEMAFQIDFFFFFFQIKWLLFKTVICGFDPTAHVPNGSLSPTTGILTMGAEVRQLCVTIPAQASGTTWLWSYLQWDFQSFLSLGVTKKFSSSIMFKISFLQPYFLLIVESLWDMQNTRRKIKSVHNNIT